MTRKGSIQVWLIRIRRYIKVKTGNALLRLSGRHRKWRVYYDIRTKQIISFGCMWVIVKPFWTDYIEYDFQPTYKQAKKDIQGDEGVVSIYRSPVSAIYTR